MGVDIESYLILGACNPRVANRALAADRSIGLLLPCNVVLRQAVEKVEVSIADPEVRFIPVDPKVKSVLEGLPQEVKGLLQFALDSLK